MKKQKLIIVSIIFFIIFILMFVTILSLSCKVGNSQSIKIDNREVLEIFNINKIKKQKIDNFILYSIEKEFQGKKYHMFITYHLGYLQLQVLEVIE